MEQYKQVNEILLKAKADIKAILTHDDDQLHLLRLDTTLQREADRLGLLTGTTDIERAVIEETGPAKTLLGKPITDVKPTAKAAETDENEAKKNKLAEFRAKVDEAYTTLPQKTNEEILGSVEESVVRGVAKKAGLKVTKDNPEKITTEFLEEIRTAIANKTAKAAETENPQKQENNTNEQE